MTALIVIASIILFFVLLLSVKLSATVHLEDGFSLDVSWLFIKLHILPKQEKKKKKKKKKKPKKEKKKKEEPKPEEKPKDETVPEPKKKKKDNIITRFYHNRGVPGFIELLKNLVNDLKGMFGRIIRAFIIDDLFISIIVSEIEASDTAEKYGKLCAEIYPLLGYLTTAMRIRNPRCEIIPDFGSDIKKTTLRLHAKISVVPRRLIGAVLIVGVQLLFNVLLKLLSGSRKKKKA